MSTLEIVIYVIAVIILIIGLLLSNSGSTGGLAALSGQDLEIFKKTKDRGSIKILQIVMFSLVFLLLIIAVVYRIVVASHVG
ncbi:preprotein translocase subunit SecG [Mycoplasmoides fastidiosum]|uniref:Preprotein translocase subunit SecG n=1 Tax=Mycoplasmoides fastidiosum TaxID=92758 RepID=A0ABU0M070_9BACT|nr:preprotein translocase subunit SecG [Mycoplasmoides fastidiosum]MDQ0514339.1 preprotein translocase subunit SecG [Mycoplasmoides fastidiosum]UUD38059.1 preprotein translocase subunit SecG [Mycoplasmoides fastidiosum]